MPRTTDPIWKFFERTVKASNSGKWATCKKCRREMQGIPSRMKIHYDECSVDHTAPHEIVENEDDDQFYPDPLTSQSQCSDVRIIGSVETRVQPNALDDAIPSTSAASNPSMNTAKPLLKRKRVTYVPLNVAKDCTVVSTSDAYGEKIGEQIGRYFFATNTPFSHVEHPEFIKLCHLMRPGYEPPTRKQLGEEVLKSWRWCMKRF